MPLFEKTFQIFCKHLKSLSAIDFAESSVYVKQRSISQLKPEKIKHFLLQI